MADAESRFLQNREVREQQKKSRDGPNEDTIARETFVSDMESLHKEIQGLLGESKTPVAAPAAGAEPDAEAPPALSPEETEAALENCKVAHTKWLTMQDTIKVAAEVCNLPAHELRSANSLLYHLFTKIDKRKSELNGTNKKFKFGSKVKLCKKTKTMIKEQAAAEESIAAALQSSGSTNALDSREGNDIISKRSNETVFIGSKKAVFIRHCTNCVFLVLPTSGSLFMDNCKDCKLYCASHQLRMKSCHKVDVFVCCRSTPIIEACREMRFGPYTAWTGLLKSTLPPTTTEGASATTTLSSHAEWVKVVGNINNYETHAANSYTHIDDFDWLRHQHSPHWSIFEEEKDYLIEERVFQHEPEQKS